jgi:histidine triad (HIT) family protein
VFCAIARGELPSYQVLATDRVLAFLDIHPVAPGHTLVVPRTHFGVLTELPDDLAGDMLIAVRQVAQAVVQVHGAHGFNVLQANGRAAGQTVGHLHFHVIPRRQGDQLRLHVPLGTASVREEDMQEEARRLREALAGASA